MSQKIDMKFYGSIYKAKDDRLLAEDEYVVFLVQDTAFAEVLPEYLDACVRGGCSEEQVQGVRDLIQRVNDWRAAHPEACKLPDIEPGERFVR